MEIRLITLSFDEQLGGFPDDALKQLSASGEILDVREHFFTHGGVPRLLLVVHLRPAIAPTKPRQAQGPDPGVALPASLKPLYSTLRRWRNDRAKEEGIPSYVILRNKQIADISRRLPRTIAALKEIQGVGEATCRKYGRDILSLIPTDLQEAKSTESGKPEAVEVSS